MRERLERTVAEIEAARRNQRTQEEPADVASPPVAPPRADPDVARVLNEQILSISQRIDRLDATLKSIDGRLNPGVNVLERRIASSVQQTTIMLGVILLIVLALAVLIMARG